MTTCAVIGGTGLNQLANLEPVAEHRPEFVRQSWRLFGAEVGTTEAPNECRRRRPETTGGFGPSKAKSSFGYMFVQMFVDPAAERASELDKQCPLFSL